MKIFAIDHRSVRIFRFGLAVIMLADCGLRLTNFTAFHTDSGVYPSSFVTLFSVFNFFDSALWAGLIFAAMATTAVALICNYRPRLMSFLGFVLTLSLMNRNPLIVYGGDDLFRLGLIWSAFLPSGPAHNGEKSFSSAASFGALAQLWMLYFSAGLNKDFQGWVIDGRGAFVALNSDTYARSTAHILLRFPTLVTLCSLAVFALERVGWLLFFSPWKTAATRMLAFVLFAGMHLSFGFFLHLELFPLVDMVFLTLLIPTEFWDWLKIRELGVVVTPPVLERWTQGTAAVFAWFLISLSIAYVPQLDWEVPRLARAAASAFGVNQGWSMFAPLNGLSDGYYRLYGRTESGELVDLINQRKLSGWPAKPVDGQREQGGFRWTRYFEELNHRENKKLSDQMIDYFCDRWKPSDPAEKNLNVTWYHISEVTIRPSLPVVPFMKTLHEKKCSAP